MRYFLGHVGWAPTAVLRDGTLPRAVEAATAGFTGTSVTIGIGRTDLTPANYWNIVLVLSNQAPNVPSGWTLTLTSASGPADAFGNTWRVYALERAADTTTSVTITFPTVASPNAATGTVMSLFIDDTTVLARGTTGLAATTSLIGNDLDRTDPASTMLFGILYSKTSTPDSVPSWDFVASINRGPTPTSLMVSQYEAEPPSTDWTAFGTQQFYAWMYWELGSP